MGEIQPNKESSSVKGLLAANRGLLQAAGSWSVDACCAVHGNTCYRDDHFSDGTPYFNPCSGQGCDHCYDYASSSDWLFGLWPGPPQRFEPTGTDTNYQHVDADWPNWGYAGADLAIGGHSGAPGGSAGYCHQGRTYRCLLYTSDAADE